MSFFCSLSEAQYAIFPLNKPELPNSISFPNVQTCLAVAFLAKDRSGNESHLVAVHIDNESGFSGFLEKLKQRGLTASRLLVFAGGSETYVPFTSSVTQLSGLVQKLLLNSTPSDLVHVAGTMDLLRNITRTVIFNLPDLDTLKRMSLNAPACLAVPKMACRIIPGEYPDKMLHFQKRSVALPLSPYPHYLDCSGFKYMAPCFPQFARCETDRVTGGLAGTVIAGVLVAGFSFSLWSTLAIGATAGVVAGGIVDQMRP